VCVCVGVNELRELVLYVCVRERKRECVGVNNIVNHTRYIRP